MGSNASPPKVPAALLAERRAGWNAFTKITFWHCIGLAALLLAMLLVFRVL